MMVEGGSALVEPACMPGIRECEAVEVEVMAELVAEGAEERPERSDLFANRRAYPDADQHGIGVVVAEKLGCGVFANAKWSGGKDANAATRDLVEIRAGCEKVIAGASDIAHGAGLHGRCDGIRDCAQA